MQLKKALLLITKGDFGLVLIFSFAVLFLLISSVIAGEPTGETKSYLPVVIRDGTSVVSATSTPSPTNTPTMTVSATSTPSPTNTPTTTVSATSTATPTNTPTSTPVVTPGLGDLVVGQPLLISTPPIIAYQPLEFQVVITNTGESDITYPFYVDVSIYPAPWNRHENYTLVASLPSGISQTLAITSPFGYEFNGGTMDYYGQVDMGNLVSEGDEFNNGSTIVSDVLVVTPIATPTYSPTPNGAYQVRGFVWSFREGNWQNQPRAFVQLIDSSSKVVDSALADRNGYFHFNGIFPGIYTLTACVSIDGQEYFGQFIDPTFGGNYIYMMPSECP